MPRSALSTSASEDRAGLAGCHQALPNYLVTLQLRVRRTIDESLSAGVEQLAKRRMTLIFRAAEVACVGLTISMFISLFYSNDPTLRKWKSRSHLLILRQSTPQNV
jgi:hypothetical protein